MKKSLSIVFILLIGVITACGGESNRITGEIEHLEQGGGVSSSGSAAADTGAAGDATDPDGDRSIPDRGFVFTHRGTRVEIDADFAPILAELGEPRSYFEAASCAFDGLDKVFTYNGFEIDTYPQGDNDFVSAIVLRDDTVATAEGIMIGSSREDMEVAYGTGTTTDSGQIVYEKDGMRLCFILTEDDIIISIEYQTMVLDGL